MNNGGQLTYRIAMAAGKDAADRQMKAAGRSAWSKADYGVACETVDMLMKKAGLLPMLPQAARTE